MGEVTPRRQSSMANTRPGTDPGTDPGAATRVLIRGAGDLASGVALRLARCGFPVVMSELERPLAVRRAVSFAQAVFDGACRVEEISALRCDAGEVDGILATGVVPVLVEPSAEALAAVRADVVVDAIMAKRNLGTTRALAPLVIALGPGFRAGEDCHAVIETNRGHRLGRVLWQGSAEPNTGVPGEIGGATHADRVLRAPSDGYVQPGVAIGDHVAEGDVIAVVGEPRQPGAPLIAPFAGVLRGLIHPSVRVPRGLKIGDLDARAQREACFTVSDKALSIAGGVLEAILVWRAQGPA